MQIFLNLIENFSIIYAFVTFFMYCNSLGGVLLFYAAYLVAV